MWFYENTHLREIEKVIGTYLNDKKKQETTLSNQEQLYMYPIYQRVLVVRVLIKLWVGVIFHWLGELKQCWCNKELYKIDDKSDVKYKNWTIREKLYGFILYAWNWCSKFIC